VLSVLSVHLETADKRINELHTTKAALEEPGSPAIC